MKSLRLLTQEEKRHALAAQAKLLTSVLGLTKNPNTPTSFTRVLHPIISEIENKKRETL
jgi:hypothetical protein